MRRRIGAARSHIVGERGARYRAPPGFALKKNEPRLNETVNATSLWLEASGRARRIFARWFAPVARPFRIEAE